MKQKLIFFLIVIIVIIMIGSCGVNHSVNQNEISNVKNFPSKYKKSSKSLVFNTDIIVDNSANEILYGCTANNLNFKKKKVLKLLFKNEKYKLADNTNNSFTSENESTLYIDNNYLAFNSNSEIERSVLDIFSLFPENYTANKFFNTKDFSQPDLKSGKIGLKKQLSKLGLKNFELTEVYFLNNKKSQESGKTNVYNEDRCKYWVGFEKCQGLPVFNTAFNANITETWAPIQILTSKKNIEKIQVLYNYDFTNNSTPLKLKPFNIIAKTLENEYSQILTDNTYEVLKSELYFWVDSNQDTSEFNMIPVWVNTIMEYQPDKNNKTREFQKIVNAQTGEIVEVGE